MNVVTPPETFEIAQPEFNRLFPFYILMDRHENPLVLGLGSVLGRLIDTSDNKMQFDSLFEILRPRRTLLDVETLCKSNKTFVIKHRHSALTLRGLFVALANGHVLFACSVEVTSSQALTENQLAINDFSPADPTPDIVILQRFREMQLDDQKKQIADLKKLIAARDMFDRHANTDELTGIGNRRSFWAQCNQTLSALDDQDSVALLIMDLDGFKKINDNHGHDVGDLVLQTFARRCEQVIGEQGFVARLGGDEFVALCRSTAKQSIQAVIDRLMDTLSEPMNCLERRLLVRPSMGGSLLKPGDSVEEAMHFADMAMYDGRKRGDQGISWFTHDMQVRENYRSSILAGIEQAIEQRLIVPYFQPIVDIKNNCIHGFEALARWHHPVHGLVYPDLFISLAAESGCLDKLDLLILESALDQLKAWDALNRNYTMHVNLCGTSVFPGVEEIVLNMLSERNVATNRLTIELTETTLLDIRDESMEALYKLAQHGVVLQLDDFGTGYSSLTHLHEFPVTGVKIDRSFLYDYPDNKRCKALIESVLNIVKHLDMDVVTEGIETDEQFQWVASLGCSYGQGYLFGKPMPADECEYSVMNWLSAARKAA